MKKKINKQMGGLAQLNGLLVPAALVAAKSLMKNKTISDSALFKNRKFVDKFNKNVVSSIKNTVKKTIHSVKNIRPTSLKKTFKKRARSIGDELKSGIRKASTPNLF
jgi:acetyl-CoA carboxylase alpha subunit